MSGFDSFLELYGLPAVFVLMLTKSVGVPVPIPADVILLAAAAGAAQGKMSLWQALVAIFLAMVLGSIVQYRLAQRIGRAPLYRLGAKLGLTEARLDAAAARVQQGGVLAITVAMLMPGVRAGSVAACGLVNLPIRTFLSGLVLSTALFLAFHFAIGFVGGPFVAALAGGVPLWQAGGLAVLVLAGGFGIWYLVRRRQRPLASRREVLAEAFEAWHEATCPACLVLGSVDARFAHVQARPAS